MKASYPIYIDLGPGLCAEVSLAVFEEAMPTPHERASRRLPTVAELRQIADKVRSLRWAYAPPFPIETEPHLPAGAVRLAERFGAPDPARSELFDIGRQKHFPGRLSRFWSSLFGH